VKQATSVACFFLGEVNDSACSLPVSIPPLGTIQIRCIPVTWLTLCPVRTDWGQGESPVLAVTQYRLFASQGHFEQFFN
jgi:hypothetical protein